MAAIGPSYLNGVVPFNPYYNTDISRRFVRTTRSAASTLLKGTIEALNTGNEMEFPSAYLMYAGILPSNVGSNDGGAIFDVLKKLLHITYNQAVAAIITNSELQNLGSRLQTNSLAPRADVLLRTVCIQVIGATRMEVDMFGSDPLIVTVSNTNVVEAQDFIFNYNRPTELMISCTTQFVYGPAGQALRPPNNFVFLNSDTASAYVIVIPIGSTRRFTFNATTPHLMDPATNFIKASSGYERAKANRIFDVRFLMNACAHNIKYSVKMNRSRRCWLFCLKLIPFDVVLKFPVSVGVTGHRANTIQQQ
jgi:VP8 protein